MDMQQIGNWAKSHPWETGAIVFGGGLVLLWAFGYLGGSSSSSASTTSNNMAAAYYAAEQQQVATGGAIQIAAIQNTNATAQMQLQTDAATAINAANDTAAVKMNASQYGAYQTVSLAGISANQTIQDTQSANSTAASEAATAAAAATAQAQAQAATAQDFYNNILAPELARSGGQAAFQIPGVGWGAVANQPSSPNTLIAMGYTPAEANNIAMGQSGIGAAPAANVNPNTGLPIRTVADVMAQAMGQSQVGINPA